MNSQMIERIFAAIRSLYSQVDGIPFIMGGAATDFRRCTDVDVFFTLSSSGHDHGYVDGTAKIGEFFMPEIGKKVQVMTSHQDVFTVLNAMDLSVHQWALDSEGRRFGAATATMPNGPIYRLRASADNTYERAMKLSQRYGQPIVDLSEPTSCAQPDCIPAPL